MQDQVYTFFIFILNGFLIGLLFDTFRILRKSFNFSNMITNLQDIIFWILSGFILIYSIFKFTNGELRLYIFLGILFGFILYLLLFSKIYIKVCVNIVLLVKKLLYYIIGVPIKFISKILKQFIINPVRYIFKIFFKKMSNQINKTIKKVKKGININKNSQEKKDFA